MRSDIAEAQDIEFEGLTEPQLVLPSQFFSHIGEATVVEGERRLISAVLEDALLCFRKYAFASNSRGRTLFRNAEEWFMEPDTGAAFTFEYICEAGGLDAESIRARLRRWQQTQAARLRGETERSRSRVEFGPDRSEPLRKASGE